MIKGSDFNFLSFLCQLRQKGNRGRHIGRLETASPVAPDTGLEQKRGEVDKRQRAEYIPPVSLERRGQLAQPSI